MNIQVGNTLMKTHTLFTPEQIRERVARMAVEINKSHTSEKPLTILIVLHGAILFAADLIRGLDMPTFIESIRVKSYEGTQSTGHVQLVGNRPEHLKGKDVLIVEDIVDTGHTVKYLMELLQNIGVSSVKVATLLDKPEAHQHPLQLDHVGFSIGRNFVIGYGLDLDGLYRNLPYVAELTPA